MTQHLRTVLFVLLLAGAVSARAQAFETAAEAVIHMGLGWNLGNTLESNSGDTTNMWIERWTNRTPAQYERAWGQVPATRELIHMMKEAGFGAIRVPVTWYPHMGVTLDASGVWHRSEWQPDSVDEAWIARVQQVVDYVVDEGLYCVLNVHHDTGEANTAWLRASTGTYDRVNNAYRALWTQIATRFRDYDEHLVFEAYNEMLDEHGSWCYAGMSAPGGYSAASAADSYTAINSYAAAFVSTVRATGGNNAVRNLMINTYGACSGIGTWNSHLSDPLTQLALPTDPAGTQHMMVSVHSYPPLKNGNTYISASAMQQQNRQQIATITTHLIGAKNVPVVIGEWGTANGEEDYNGNRTLYLQFVSDMASRCLAAGICPMYWMGLSDGTHRSVPEFNQPDVVNTMMSVTQLPDARSACAPSARTAVLRDGSLLITRNDTAYTVLGLPVGQ